MQAHTPGKFTAMNGGFFFLLKAQSRAGKVQSIFLLWNLVLQDSLPAFCGALRAPVTVADENWWMVGVRLRSVLGLINMCTDARAAGKDVFFSQVDWNWILSQFVFTKYAWKQSFFFFFSGVGFESMGFIWFHTDFKFHTVRRRDCRIKPGSCTC